MKYGKASRLGQKVVWATGRLENPPVAQAGMPQKNKKLLSSLILDNVMD